MSYRLKPRRRHALLLFAIAVFVLAACSAAQIGGNNWPGISANQNTVYIAYGPSVAAVDISTQRELWRYTPQGSSGALLAPPQAADDAVYFGDYGASQGLFSSGVSAFAYVLNASNGTERVTPFEVAEDRIVAPVEVQDGIMVVGSADNKVTAVDTQTGMPVWAAPFEAEHSIWGQPTIEGGSVFVTSMDRNVYSLDIDDGSEQWRFETSGAIAASPLVVDDVVYVVSFDGKLHALDVNDGTEFWSVGASDWIWSEPAYDNGTLYFADDEGSVYSVDAASGAINWTAQTGVQVQAGVTVDNGSVFVPGIIGVSQTTQTGKLISLSAEDGTINWQIDLDMPIYSTPIVADEQLAVLVTILEANTVGEFELRTFNPESGTQIWSYVPAE